MPPPFEARIHRGRSAALLLLSLGITALGVVISRQDGLFERLIGWAAVALFGSAATVVARLLCDRRVQVRVDGDGLYARRWSNLTVPWTAIRGVGAGLIYGQKLLSVEVDDPAQWRRRSAFAQLARLNPALGYGELTISMTGLDRGFGELMAAVASHRAFTSFSFGAEEDTSPDHR